MAFARAIPVSAILALLALAPSCDESQGGDPPSSAGTPPPTGRGNSIHEIADPASPKKAAHGSQVSVTGAVVVAVDTFDETGNGKSAGSIYVSDLGSKQPYSGISLFNPSFIPGNLRVNAGDSLDLRGQFQENQDVPVKFAPGAFLVQLSGPIGTYRFDANVPDPIDIEEQGGSIKDFADYAKGRRWLNMLVRLKNVKLQRDAFQCSSDKQPGSTKSGRVSAGLLAHDEAIDSGANASTKCEDPFPKTPTLVNELMDIVPLTLKEGTVLNELVGVVTFFCNFHIAPRSAADIVIGSEPPGPACP